MQKSVYENLLSMLPVSPESAVSPPETLGAGKTLAFRARITLKEIHALVVHCTGEDPDKDTSDLQNWKEELVRDEEGNVIKEEYSVTDADGNTTLKTRNLKKWVPIHFKGNRVPTKDHYRSLVLRYARVGFQPAVRTFTFSWTGDLLDGQHGLISLWHYLSDYEVGYVDIDVKIVGKPPKTEDAEAIFRLFDQAMRKRTLKDALSTIHGIPEGFESELAGTLRFCTLIASGKGINSSRLQLPHILNDKGSPQKLEADDIAGFIGDGEPFHYLHNLLLDVLKQTTKTEAGASPTLTRPEVTGSGMPNAQYYLTAFANFIYDPQVQEKLTESKAIEICKSFLDEITKGENSKHKAIVKMLVSKPKKAVDWLPIIERALQCFANETNPPKTWPKNLTFNGIVESYNLWVAEFYPDADEVEHTNIEETMPDGALV